MPHSRQTIRKTSFVATSVALALASFSVFATPAHGNSPRLLAQDIERSSAVNLERLKSQPRSRLAIAEPSYYIVELEAPALSAYLAEQDTPPTYSAAAATGVTPANRLNLQSVQAQEYGAFLTAQQNQFAQHMQRRLPSATIHKQFSTALNAVVVKTHDSSARQLLREMDGVKAVYRSEMRYAMLDQIRGTRGLIEAWEQAGGQERAGEGIRIAIIDSGIRPENPMFYNTGLAPVNDRPNDDYCATQDPSFCTDKIIVARYSQPTFTIHEDEHLSPLDYSGHGSHVAGIAAGAPVVANYQALPMDISGVAPGAYLMVYKALFTAPSSPGGGSDVMLVEALEHAFNDGADVINNSWGGGPGDDGSGSVYDSLFANLEAAGVVVVTAAGNDGPAAQSIGCPGCVESGITVAAVDASRTFIQRISFQDENYQMQIGNGDFVIDDVIDAPLLLAGQISAENVLACEPFAEEALLDAIVLVNRGECTFELKAENVAAAGARAMIVGNSEEGLVTMDMGEATLPSVVIAKSTATLISDAYMEGDHIQILPLRMDPGLWVGGEPAIAPFSARGPGGNSSFLKPDVSAPGEEIFSATSPDTGRDFNLMSGTSMAAPHVAGSVAIIKQLRPELSAYQIKAILSGTANGIHNRSAFSQGGGIVNAYNALGATFALDRGAYVDNDCRISCTVTVSLTNLTDAEQAYTVQTPYQTRETLIVDLGSSVTDDGERLVVAAGETESFSMTFDSRFAPDGWNEFNFSVSDNETTQSFPLLFSANRADDARVLSSTVSTGEPSWGERVTVETYFAGSSTVENQLRVNFPASVEIANVRVEENNASGSLDIQGDHALWTGSFQTVSEESGVTAVALPAYTLANMPSSMMISDVLSIGCQEEVCDEIVVPVTGLDDFGGLPYNGTRYDILTIWDNGIVAPGDQSSTPVTYINRELPSDERPNNVIAPFWTDFVLGGELGGEIYFAAVTHQDKDYVVVEWRDAKIWSESVSASDPAYTVQVWLRIGDTDQQQVLFNYIAVPEMPRWVTIGMEDFTGKQGFTYHYDGTGPSVASGDALEATLAVNNSDVLLSYDLPLDMAGNHVATTAWNTPVTVNVLEGLTFDERSYLGDAIATVGDDIFSSSTPIIVRPQGGVVLNIASQHSGVAEVYAASGTIHFEPLPSFSGVEVVEFYLSDNAGNRTQNYQLEVTVERRNSKKWYQGGFALWLGVFGLVVALRRSRGLAKLNAS